jgi:hypothetical protein
VLQLPEWRQQVAAWADAAQTAGAQFRQFASDLNTLGRQSAIDLTSKTVGVVWAVPAEVLRRLNVFELATRHDVEETDSRMTDLLEEIAVAQRGEHLALVESLRAELLEELHSLAAAIGDDLFAPEPAAPPARPPILDLDDDELDDEEREIDLVSLEELESLDDDYADAYDE